MTVGGGARCRYRLQRRKEMDDLEGKSWGLEKDLVWDEVRGELCAAGVVQEEPSQRDLGFGEQLPWGKSGLGCWVRAESPQSSQWEAFRAP
jgi:hypothetical protein